VRNAIRNLFIFAIIVIKRQKILSKDLKVQLGKNVLNAADQLAFQKNEIVQIVRKEVLKCSVKIVLLTEARNISVIFA